MPRRELLLAACLLLAPAAVAVAGEDLRLQGLFCNAEDQIDRTLARMGHGLDPHRAVDLENREAVVCTYVDRLHYLVRNPVSLGADRSFVPTLKYEASLVGVAVGGAVRPVSPPVRVFFVTPGPIPAALVEQRR
jgi:hypothetical protein